MATIKFADLQKQAQAAARAKKDPLSPGKYDAWVSWAKPYSTRTGKPYIRVGYLTHGEEVTVFDSMFINEDRPNSLRVFFLRMEALGVTSTFFENEPSIEQVAAELIGRECQIEVSLELDEYSGENVNRVLKVLPKREESPGSV